MARGEAARAALPFLIAIAIVHLVVAWPGAATRGIIAEEVQPYLRHYPAILDTTWDRSSGPESERATFLPPNDDPKVREAVARGRATEPRWVGTNQWPEVGYQSRSRVWPVFVRGHQTSIGTMWGLLIGPLFGDGMGGVRRANVALGLVLLGLVWGVGRRLGLSRAFAALAAIGCALSPGLWFVCRTGYGYEIASRVLMMATLFAVARLGPITGRQALIAGVAFAGAILSRATIATTLVPPLFLMLFHPRRFTGVKRVAALLGVGGGAPIALVAIALMTLPFASGTEPAAALPLDALARRTLLAPAFGAVQLAWVADARMILTPLVEGGLTVSAGLVRPAVGGLIALLALVRWWRGRAREGERLFVAGLLGNTMLGAWLYGNPLQFQLGMALEPLFALAVAHQLQDLAEHREGVAAAIAAVLLGARLFTLDSLAASERRTDNPMLSGRAQQALVAALRERRVTGDDLVTTTYDHVGVIESWTHESLRPIHAWRLLKAAGVPEDRIVDRWRLIFRAHPVCHVLITRAPNLVAGRFSDALAVERALVRVLAERGQVAGERVPVAGNGGGVVFELWTLSPCAPPKDAP